MTPSSRSKDKASDIDVPISSSVPSFHFFLQLPREITDRIITLACRSPSPTIPAYRNSSLRSPLALDVETTLSLARVSKPVNEIVNRVLYNAVKITRPSALLELLHTVSSRPQLGKLIKNLHIGAEETLADQNDWPLEMRSKENGVSLDYPVLYLRSSLSSEDEAVLPTWYSWKQSWCLEPGRLDCQSSAVMAAIKVALKEINVEPYRRGLTSSEERIRLEDWSRRIYQVQGCLDLYLMEMRRKEDKSGYAVKRKHEGPPQDPHICRLGKCGHYPRLVLPAVDEGDPNRRSRGRIFTLSREQLWNHLTRRGGVLDHFDHPINFARTPLKAVAINKFGRKMLRSRLAGPHANHFTPEEYDPQDVASDDESDYYDSDEYDEQDNLKVKDSKLASTHTFSELIGTVGEVLLATPNLVNLSLNSFLQLAACADAPVFETLRSLAISAWLPFWNLSISLDPAHRPMPRLQNLLISGDVLSPDKAEQIAGKDGAMPSLRRFIWELVYAFEPLGELVLSPGLIYNLISRLQGSNGAGHGVPRLIEVRLHPVSYVAVLDHAAPDIRNAWQLGRRLPKGHVNGPNRVHVVKSVAADASVTVRNMAAKRLHHNGEEWWEDCAALARYPARQRSNRWMPNASGRCIGGVKWVGEEEEEKQLEEGEEEGERVAEGAQAMQIEGE